MQTRTGNLLQTRPANASRHSEPLTGHPELDSGSAPPTSPHLPQIPGQARNDAPNPPPQAPATLQKKHASAFLPKPATANTRRFAKSNMPTPTRPNPPLPTRAAPQKKHAPAYLPTVAPPRQKKSRQPKPPGKVKRQPSKKNGRLKKLLVNSSRSLCTSINCSLCSLKLLSIALLAELADCALSSVNSFLCSTIHKSL